jgi:hypothetical protein
MDWVMLENFAANIAAHAEYFRVFAIDLLGSGWNDRPNYSYTSADVSRPFDKTLVCRDRLSQNLVRWWDGLRHRLPFRKR